MKIGSTFHMDDVKGFQADLIKQVCERAGVVTETKTPLEILNSRGGVFVHDPLEFQHQIFTSKKITFPYMDKEDFELDEGLYLDRKRSEAEIRINDALFQIPQRAIHVSPLGNNYFSDISDKLNAQMILPILGIPVPKLYNRKDYSGQRLFVKNRRGRIRREPSVIKNPNFLKEFPDLEESVIQEEVKIPTEGMSYVRIAYDFGEMTAAEIIYSHTDKPESQNIGRILLSCHGFEHKQRLTEEENKILDIYNGREIPQKLSDYSKIISDYTQSIGLHSIGIDFIYDSENKKWVCTGDVNRPPDRTTYLELEKARGNAIENNPANRAYAAAKYVSGPFKDYLKKL